ncbi:MAG TPA: type II CAAX endopeptidase family protein [Rudaea sp.]|nr:type II CAAX endopeptidase family protein [Rudaea sp.]
MSLRFSVRARQAPLFFILAFVLSWYPWLLGMLGVPKASGINPLGVFAGALIVAGLSEGWAGIKALLARLVRWRVGWGWFAAAIGIPVVTVALACALNVAFGAPEPTAAQWAQWPDIVDKFIFAFIFVGLGEEPGWRGFALPALYRHRSPLAASLLLGAVWAVWHVPLMGSEFAWNTVPCFLISVLAGSVVLAWLFNGSRESVLLCMLMHATVNAVGAGYAFHFFAGENVLRLWWIYALVWAAAAALIAWRAGPALARHAQDGVSPRPSRRVTAASIG